MDQSVSPVRPVTDLGDRGDMTTYLINHLRIPNGVPTPNGLEYLERVEETFAPYGGRYLVLDAPVQSLEGAWSGSAVLMEFPDMDAAKAWYFSPAYQEILPLRTGTSISDLVLVDAAAADFTAKRWAGQIRAEIARST